jgi:hypothetical protein
MTNDWEVNWMATDRSSEWNRRFKTDGVRSDQSKEETIAITAPKKSKK